MYGNVAAHAWSPPNFPHSETTAKLLRSVPALSPRHKFMRVIRVGDGLENCHLVRSGANVSATVCATVVAFYRVTVKHLSTSRWNAASSKCSDLVASLPRRNDHCQRRQ